MILQNNNDFIVCLRKSEIPHDGEAVITLAIEDDPIFRIELIREDDGSLYYRVEEVANPHFVIEGNYPEYFPEVTT